MVDLMTESTNEIPTLQAKDEQNTALGDNVITLEHGGRTFHIIGTAHISAQSVIEVRETIERVRPDSVCVELCQTRFQAMNDPDRWKKTQYISSDTPR
jgi:pheromone shutdown protein TraB